MLYMNVHICAHIFVEKNTLTQIGKTFQKELQSPSSEQKGTMYLHDFSCKKDTLSTN